LDRSPSWPRPRCSLYPEPPPSRFPCRVHEVGAEPDPRFTLANERTFLAWIRVALALIAGGVALEALALPLQSAPRLTASIILLVLGLAVPLLAWFTFSGVCGR
jgi:putative membrane protein